jgi:hypothetical protein
MPDTTRHWTGLVSIALTEKEKRTLEWAGEPRGRVANSRYADEELNRLGHLGLVDGAPCSHRDVGWHTVTSRSWRYHTTPAGLAWLASCQKVEVEVEVEVARRLPDGDLAVEADGLPRSAGDG